MDLPCPCGALLVGSVPLADSAAVFRAVTAKLGRYLKRIPDGETGPRANWIAASWRYSSRSPSLNPKWWKSATSSALNSA